MSSAQCLFMCVLCVFVSLGGAVCRLAKVDSMGFASQDTLADLWLPVVTGLDRSQGH